MMVWRGTFYGNEAGRFLDESARLVFGQSERESHSLLCGLLVELVLGILLVLLLLLFFCLLFGFGLFLGATDNADAHAGDQTETEQHREKLLDHN